MFPSKPWLLLLLAFQAMQGCTSLLCSSLRGSIELARLVLVHVCQSPAWCSLCTALPRAGTHLASRVILIDQSPTAIENTKLDLRAATNIHGKPPCQSIKCNKNRLTWRAGQCKAPCQSIKCHKNRLTWRAGQGKAPCQSIKCHKNRLTWRAGQGKAPCQSIKWYKID